MPDQLTRPVRDLIAGRLGATLQLTLTAMAVATVLDQVDLTCLAEIDVRRSFEALGAKTAATFAAVRRVKP